MSDEWKDEEEQWEAYRKEQERFCDYTFREAARRMAEEIDARILRSPRSDAEIVDDFLASL